jgi:hypothetical protein
MESEYKVLADALFWEKLERARRVPPEERMKAGPELFDYACAITMNSLRERMPAATEAELLAKVRERLAIKRELEEATR